MLKTVNKVIKTLILSDLFLNLGWGLLSPVFALFVLENISNSGALNAAQIAGLAALFYWIPKSLFEIPFGFYLDKHRGEKDDFWFMFLGYLIISFVPIGYMFSSIPEQIYILQIVYAAGMAMSLPSWLAIFTRHIDKEKEGFEWSLETSSIGTGAGIAGGLSGILVSIFGFRGLFLFVSIFTLISAFLLLIIRNHLFIRDGHSVSPVEKKPIVEP
jgi:MFS family permease